MNTYIRLCAVSAMLLSLGAHAADIRVEHAWARATAPGQDTAMVDLTITSAHRATLVGFSSKVCESAEMHSMTQKDGMMKMREVDSIDLPRGSMSLEKSGYHLMLVGLHSQLKEGERVPLTLDVREDGRDIRVKVIAEVRPLTAVMDKSMPGM